MENVTDKQIINKMAEIMRLAAKTTIYTVADIFVEYQPHVRNFEIRIYVNGWEPNTPSERENVYVFNKVLSRSNEIVYKHLCNMCKHVKRVYDEAEKIKKGVE